MTGHIGEHASRNHDFVDTSRGYPITGPASDSVGRSKLSVKEGQPDSDGSQELYERRLGLRLVIEQVVARVFGVARGELRLSTRGRAKVALARQVAMYLAHVVFGLSLTEVGRAFDRDRTTVSHACGVVEDRRDDPIFDRALENLERIVVVWRAKCEVISRLRR